VEVENRELEESQLQRPFKTQYPWIAASGHTNNAERRPPSSLARFRWRLDDACRHLWRLQRDVHVLYSAASTIRDFPGDRIAARMHTQRLDLEYRNELVFLVLV
jgi:hypothetical protein